MLLRNMASETSVNWPSCGRRFFEGELRPVLGGISHWTGSSYMLRPCEVLDDTGDEVAALASEAQLPRFTFKGDTLQSRIEVLAETKLVGVAG